MARSPIYPKGINLFGMGATKQGLTRRLQFAFKLDGDKELERKIKRLPAKVFRRVVAKASDKAMDPVLASAKQNALAIKDWPGSQSTGLLADSLIKKQKTYKRAEVVVTIVGPDMGVSRVEQVERTLGDTVMTYERTLRPGKYAHLVELGVDPHSLGKGSKTSTKGKHAKDKHVDTGGAQHPGASPRPFLRPAMEENKYRIIAIYREEVGRFIEREAKKTA